MTISSIIGRFFPSFLNRPQRRWYLAVGEVVSITVFAIAISVLFGRSYRIGANDPGMAKVTAICFAVLSIGTFVLSVSLKNIDREHPNQEKNGRT